MHNFLRRRSPGGHERRLCRFLIRLVPIKISAFDLQLLKRLRCSTCRREDSEDAYSDKQEAFLP